MNVKASKRKVLVLGGDGALAQEIKACFGMKHWVQSLDHKQCDVVSLPKVKEIIKKYNPDIVINCAAFKDVEDCEEQKDQAIAINALSTRNLSKAIETTKIKIVWFSTDYVFDGEREGAYSEIDRTNPINQYGSSKLMGEGFLKALNKNYLIMRLANLYCNSGSNFIDSLVQTFTDDENVKMVDDRVISLTNGSDAAIGLLKLIDRDFVGIFHFANRGSTTPFEVAEFVLAKLRALHRPVRTKKLVRIKQADLKLKAQRPQRISLSCSKFETFVGSEIPTWQKSLGIFLERNYAGK